jgi:cell division septum initiation protein DivIVA
MKVNLSVNDENEKKNEKIKELEEKIEKFKKKKANWEQEKSLLEKTINSLRNECERKEWEKNGKRKRGKTCK